MHPRCCRPVDVSNSSLNIRTPNPTSVFSPEAFSHLDFTRLSFSGIRRLDIIVFLYIYSWFRASSLYINKIQQDAGIYLLQNYSTCFECPSHPSSGIHQTVIAASGAGHSIRVTTFCQHGLIRQHWQNVVALILWPVPEAGITVWCTPDNGCDRHPKHVE